MLKPLLYRWGVPSVVIRCVNWTMQSGVLQTCIKALGLDNVMPPASQASGLVSVTTKSKKKKFMTKASTIEKLLEKGTVNICHCIWQFILFSSVFSPLTSPSPASLPLSISIPPSLPLSHFSTHQTLDGLLSRLFNKENISVPRHWSLRAEPSVYSAVCSCTHQRKRQSSASLAIARRETTGDRWIPLAKGH